MSASASLDDVRTFWNQNSCGLKFSDADVGSQEFFKELEHHRYKLEPHILEVVNFPAFKGQRILEIGCGLGTDAVQFARAGALYTGIDLTENGVKFTRRRFEMENLPGTIQEANVEALPFADGSFDAVYSNGVIHHTPNIEKAVSEIHRVLRPGGRAIVMVYHRRSFNYMVNIMFLRRIGLMLLLVPGIGQIVARMTGESKERLDAHRANFRSQGLAYLSSKSFLNNNTDGVGNPLSRVYSRGGLRDLFGRFSATSTKVRFLNLHRIPLIRAAAGLLDRVLGRLFGWHLYVFAQK